MQEALLELKEGTALLRELPSTIEYPFGVSIQASTLEAFQAAILKVHHESIEVQIQRATAFADPRRRARQLRFPGAFWIPRGNR
jgi:hypothetical protein